MNLITDCEGTMLDAVELLCSDDGKSMDAVIYHNDYSSAIVVKSRNGFPETAYVIRYGEHHHYQALEDIDSALWIDGVDLEGYKAALCCDTLRGCRWPRQIVKWFKEAKGTDIYDYGTFAKVTDITYT